MHSCGWPLYFESNFVDLGQTPTPPSLSRLKPTSRRAALLAPLARPRESGWLGISVSPRGLS